MWPNGPATLWVTAPLVLKLYGWQPLTVAGLPKQFFLIIQEYSTKFRGKQDSTGQKLPKYSKKLRNTGQKSIKYHLCVKNENKQNINASYWTMTKNIKVYKCRLYGNVGGYF